MHILANGLWIRLWHSAHLTTQWLKITKNVSLFYYFFSILAFSTNFCLIEISLSGSTDNKNETFLGHFSPLWSPNSLKFYKWKCMSKKMNFHWKMIFALKFTCSQDQFFNNHLLGPNLAWLGKIVFCKLVEQRGRQMFQNCFMKPWNLDSMNATPTINNL